MPIVPVRLKVMVKKEPVSPILFLASIRAVIAMRVSCPHCLMFYQKSRVVAWPGWINKTRFRLHRKPKTGNKSLHVNICTDPPPLPSFTKNIADITCISS